MSTKKADSFLNDQGVFHVLGSSKLRMNLSWKNKDQIYDLECKFCQAVYSDTITTNQFGGSRKGTSTEKSILTCKNCGISQETSDSPIERKKNDYEHNIGSIPFANKIFEIVEAYKGAPEVVPEELTRLKNFKSLGIDDTPEPEPCGCDEEECENCFPPLGKIYLRVTDALIASGLNPYESEKRERLVEFYASRKNITQHEYIEFNKKYRRVITAKEKEVLTSVNRSDLIKSIACNAQFGNSRDEYALEPIANTLDALGIEVWENGTSLTTIDIRTNEKVTVEILDGNVTVTRADGCTKSGVIQNDEIQDSAEEKKDPTAEMTDEDKKIYESYVNKETGCRSEVNIHEYLKDGLFENYEHGTIPVSGEFDGVYYNGEIDGIIRAEKTIPWGESKKPVIKPIVKGKRPLVIFEIKKRMKKIFSMEELVERKYDLCQIVLYKILTQIAGTGPPSKLVIVQSFGEDIDIQRVPVEIQVEILSQFRAGIEQFKLDIKKMKKF